MHIAYLTNQYPHVRHTFIRREIVALEASGVTVSRFSVRDSGGDAVDPADKDEKTKTFTLLNEGKAKLLIAAAKAFMTRPVRFLKALAITFKFGRRSDRGVLRHGAYLAQACILCEELARRQCDHLHVHFATNPAVVAMLCRMLGGPTYSITVHGPEEWDRPESLSLKEKYEDASFVVSVSDFGRCQIYRWISLTQWPKIHVVRCGVDAGFLKVVPEPVPETNRLVLVAGLVEQKGHLMLVQSLEKVAEAGHDFQMVFVGDGHLRPILEKEVKERGLTGKVTFVGWQSNAQVREHLRTSRALIMPSFAENLPVAMMESLAMGRPVLGTYIAGVPELIENGVTGWLVPAGNIELTAAAIIRVLQTPTVELTAIGKTGAAKVARMHDANEEAMKMSRLFAQYLQLDRK